MTFHLEPNDWFLILSIFIVTWIYLVISKRMALTIRILIWLYIIFIVQTVDYILGVEPYDLYDFMDSPRWQFIYALSQFTLYPIVGYLFLHFYEKWALKGFRLIGYILGWVLVSVGYEWMSSIFNVITHTEWNFMYSAIVYALVFVSEILFLKWILYGTKRECEKCMLQRRYS